jgi:hypothetical protein
MKKMRYLIATVVIIGVCLYFFRDEFFVALDYIDQATKTIIDWIKK